MAASRMIRRKQTASAWPGYFSSAPTAPARMALDLVDDDELDHIERLRNHGVVRDVMDDIDVGDIARPRRVLPDLDLGPGRRIVGVDGEPLPIGGGRGELDAYLTSTPGQADDTGPGDFRNHWRLGMASEDEGDEPKPDPYDQEVLDRLLVAAADGAIGAIDSKEKADAAAYVYLAWVALASAIPGGFGALEEQVRKALQGFNNETSSAREAQIRGERAQKEYERWRNRLEWEGILRAEEKAKKRKRRKSPKPRPDDEVHSPSVQQRALAAQRWADFLRWGNPASDYKLGNRPTRRSLANLPNTFWEKLWEVVSGGGADTYDRLGNQTSRRLRRQLSAQEAQARMIRFRANHPAINWGDQGPPVPVPRAGGFSFVDEEEP